MMMWPCGFIAVVASSWPATYAIEVRNEDVENDTSSFFAEKIPYRLGFFEADLTGQQNCVRQPMTFKGDLPFEKVDVKVILNETVANYVKNNPWTWEMSFGDQYYQNDEENLDFSEEKNISNGEKFPDDTDQNCCCCPWSGLWIWHAWKSGCCFDLCSCSAPADSKNGESKNVGGKNGGGKKPELLILKMKLYEWMQLFNAIFEVSRRDEHLDADYKFTDGFLGKTAKALLQVEVEIIVPEENRGGSISETTSSPTIENNFLKNNIPTIGRIVRWRWLNGNLPGVFCPVEEISQRKNFSQQKSFTTTKQEESDDNDDDDIPSVMQSKMLLSLMRLRSLMYQDAGWQMNQDEEEVLGKNIHKTLAEDDRIYREMNPELAMNYGEARKRHTPKNENCSDDCCGKKDKNNADSLVGYDLYYSPKEIRNLKTWTSAYGNMSAWTAGYTCWYFLPKNETKKFYLLSIVRDSSNEFDICGMPLLRKFLKSKKIIEAEENVGKRLAKNMKSATQELKQWKEYAPNSTKQLNVCDQDSMLEAGHEKYRGHAAANTILTLFKMDWNFRHLLRMEHTKNFLGHAGISMEQQAPQYHHGDKKGILTDADFVVFYNKVRTITTWYFWLI